MHILIRPIADIDHHFVVNLKSTMEDKRILMKFRRYWDADRDFCLTFKM
jgi:hypothetical protein